MIFKYVFLRWPRGCISSSEMLRSSSVARKTKVQVFLWSLSYQAHVSSHVWKLVIK